MCVRLHHDAVARIFLQMFDGDAVSCRGKIQVVSRVP